MAAGVTLVSLLPTPTYAQYFALGVPFVIPTLATALSASWKRYAPAALVVYAVLGGFEWIRYAIVGEDVIGVDRPTPWTLSEAKRMARLLDDHADCGPVLASWPGYLIESKATSFAGMENHFSTHARSHLESAEERQRRRVVSPSELPLLIASRAVPTVVLGNWTNYAFEADPTSVLEASGYRVITTLGGTNVWGLATSLRGAQGQGTRPHQCKGGGRSSSGGRAGGAGGRRASGTPASRRPPVISRAPRP